MEFSGCFNDESLGTTVEGCRGDFDFTIKFEKICFMLLPSTLLIAIGLPRLIYLIRQTVIVGDGGRLLQAAKLVRPIHLSVMSSGIKIGLT
jgi:hypothetical protein